MIAPSTDVNGTEIGTDNQTEILPPEFTGSIIDDNAPMFSSANNQQEFRPDAKYILIDGRASADPQPSVDIINGHLMSLRDPRTNWGGADYNNLGKTNYISGSALRYHFDRDKNIIVFSYFDSSSSRWIKSIQDLPPAQANLPKPHFSNPHVFKWFIYGRAQS